MTINLKTVLFEIQNSVFRKLLMIENPTMDTELVFLGNNYSGYWFPSSLLGANGTLWGVGLGHDSSFELELMRRGYMFYGFEPEANCFESSSLQFEGTSAILFNFGLWNQSGDFHYTGENISIVDIFELGSRSSETLEIKSLWEVANELDLKQMKSPRVLKLNIEGAEKEILLRFVEEPLPFDVLIFQAEFLFHISFKSIIKKILAYLHLRTIMRKLKNLGWIVTDFSRHQVTLTK